MTETSRPSLSFASVVAVGLIGLGPACATTHPATQDQISRCLQRCEQIGGPARPAEEVTADGQSIHQHHVGSCRQQCGLLSHDEEEAAPKQKPDPFQPPRQTE